ncbi:MAG: glycogen debranching protein [Chloroflexi bacterium]|nr:MAG: glycogen debranching protein [Chloroflexota bacterium]
MIEFGRDVCGNLANSESREWLVTNGIGGFASGTIAGIMTRSYHGLLIAALQPPSGRTFLVTKLNETVSYENEQYNLNTDRWAGGVINPIGYMHIERFALDGRIPTWTYAFGDALLEKRIWMKQGVNTTFVQYKMIRGVSPMKLTAVPFINYRRMHNTTHADGWEMQIESMSNGLKISAYTGASPFYILCNQASAKANHNWHRRYFLMREANRGHNATEDHLDAGEFNLSLQTGESATFVFSTEPNFNIDGVAEFQKQHALEQKLIEQAPVLCESQPCLGTIKQLVLAADQFIVSQPLPTDPNSFTVLDGYHWFRSSTRHTILSIPGLMLTTGRAEMAGKLLRKYAFRINQGMLPDRFVTSNRDPNYDTLDATLLYIEAIRAYYEVTKNLNFVGELYPALQDIILWLQQGTHHNIHADPEDGLLHTGGSKTPMTWMNAQIDKWMVTPRIGKPVEINALWYNALCTMAYFAELLEENPQRYAKMAKEVKTGFERFWNDDLSCCYDVIDTPDGNDAKIRPNQIYAVSLTHSPLSSEQQKHIVDICARKLLTSHGLRTLAPDDPDYIGQFGGDASQRDMAYHQGTVWASLMGPFIRAHLRVYKDISQARSFIHPLCHQISSHGVGSVSELFNGEPPFGPQGCIAHAWGVAELLRSCQDIATFEENGR